MSRNSLLPALVLCFLAAFSTPASGAQEFSRVLVNEPVWSYRPPRKEVPPYSAVLDDAHHELIGLGESQEARLPLTSAETRDVLTLLGLAPRIRFGENDDSLFCYSSARKGDATAVVFVVYPDSLISVDVHSDVSRIVQGERRCMPTRSVSAAVRTKGGLRLGLTRAKVRTMFGPPHRTLGRGYLYFSERTSKPGEFGQTQVRSIHIWFGGDNRVDGFAIKAQNLD